MQVIWSPFGALNLNFLKITFNLAKNLRVFSHKDFTERSLKLQIKYNFMDQAIDEET